jgi:prepilin-type N-terminal cleavage/methylation domain-containing protein
MYKIRSRGFTLIELLVVIAIIGILSAVVLASLNTARDKGGTAAVQSDLSTVQTQAEIYYGGTGNNSYGIAGATNSCAVAGSVFVADTTVAKAIAAADLANGTDATYGVVTCNNSATAYAIQAGLPSGVGAANSRYWCVDSTGNAKPEAAAMVAGATACL